MHFLHRFTSAVVGIPALLCASLFISNAPASAATNAVPIPGYRVGVAHYDLGATAFTVPGFFTPATVEDAHPALQPIELTAEVRYPIDPSRRSHPLAVVLHGDWITCADADAERTRAEDQAKLDTLNEDDPATQAEQTRLQNEIDAAYRRLGAWPCRPGTPGETSYRGFDYLASALAHLGIITISISANGANAGILGEVQDQARAALVDKHLALWAQLERGRGPLLHALRTSAGHPLSPVVFPGRVDLDRVALIGHSRGGRAMFREAAAVNRHAWPRGVRIRAVVGLAPINLPFLSAAQEARYLPKNMPVLQWFGSCDGNGGSDYLRLGLRRTGSAMVQVDAIGANHNFLNSQWSPSSGQVGAFDDAHYGGRGRPGRCTDQTPPAVLTTDPTGGSGPTGGIHQMSETQERAIATITVERFVTRAMSSETGADLIMRGTVSSGRAHARIRTLTPSGGAVGPRL